MLVVDASIAVKFVVQEHDSALVDRLLMSPEPLVAPDWLLVESASTMWKKVARSELLMLHAERNLEALPDFFARLYPSAELIGDALRLAFRLHHSVYDCLYLALARREGCNLVTADRKFHGVLAAQGLDSQVELL
jgi:predicted nucleic acid-binding protein